MNASKSVYIPPAELVDERTQEARPGLAELAHQVVAAAGAGDGLARLGEYPLNLFVQLVPVGDDGHARVGVVLQEPPGQQHHDDALAAALGVPDDAALATLDVLLRRFDAEILVHTRQLFHAAVKQHKVGISSISRSLRHILSRYLSSLKRLLSASSSFHVRKYFSSVPMAP